MLAIWQATAYPPYQTARPAGMWGVDTGREVEVKGVGMPTLHYRESGKNGGWGLLRS